MSAHAIAPFIAISRLWRKLMLPLISFQSSVVGLSSTMCPTACQHDSFLAFEWRGVPWNWKTSERSSCDSSLNQAVCVSPWTTIAVGHSVLSVVVSKSCLIPPPTPSFSDLSLDNVSIPPLYRLPVPSCTVLQPLVCELYACVTVVAHCGRLCMYDPVSRDRAAPLLRSGKTPTAHTHQAICCSLNWTPLMCEMTLSRWQDAMWKPG